MSQRDAIIAALKTCPFIYFDNKHKLAKWSDTLHQMQAEKLISTELVEIDEQYSRLEVRRMPGHATVWR